jgi:5'-nucleotidase
VVDAGDIFQGTPYFNLFHGRVELETMSRAGYDIATLGNHDFDLGAEWLLTALERYASFAMCSSNLVFSHPSAGKLIKPYLLREVGGRRLGFFGLTIQLQGLVPVELWKGVRYLEPIRVARQMVKLLREKHHCDAVILLSHLGYTGFQQEPGDIDLAKAVKGIDLIVGGHTHTFLDKPHWVRYADGTETAIVQVGHSGIYLGQVDLHFSERRPVRVEQHALPIGKPPTER